MGILSPEARRVITRPGTWDEMRADFRWRVPERFNIARACCDDWAAAQPGRVALTHIGAEGHAQDWTYGALRDASNRLANVLAARGVRKGDVVAVLLSQSPEVLMTHFAAQKLGAVILPLFTLFGPEALRYRLADSGAVAIVTDVANAAKLDEISADLPALAHVFCTDGDPGRAANLWREIERASAAFACADTLAEDPAVIIYTSGTTGPPKGALHAHRFLLGHLPSMELHHEFYPRPGDKGWTPADWAWIGGLMDMAIPCLYYGVPLVSHRMGKFDPDAAFRLIADQGCRNLFLPPTALKLMRQARVPGGVDIRSIGSGGEALGPDILEWGRAALGVTINELYGQTECNLVLASCAGSMPVRPGSMGKPVPGFDMAIIDGQGRALPPGELGEIAVRRGPPVMFLRYLNQPEKTAEKFLGEWMRTGDLGRMDQDGYFWFESRDDDVITSSGYRIGPTEIENCLTGHPDVVMAAAVGVPDAVRTEVVRAYVVLRDGAADPGAEGLARLEAELIARVRERVSPHVAPRSVVVIPEMPTTATGKIMRRELRARAIAGGAG